jgi:hypothetical protein
MNIKYIFISILIALFFQKNVCASEREQFDAADMRKVRQISSILLGSQKAEKQRLTNQTEYEKVILNTISEYLHEISKMNRVMSSDTPEIRNNSSSKLQELDSYIKVSKRKILKKIKNSETSNKNESRDAARKTKLISLFNEIEKKIDSQTSSKQINYNELDVLANKVELKNTNTSNHTEQPTFVRSTGQVRQISVPIYGTSLDR